MERDLGELTEKEKQTLRLLAGGHDAKSAARALDLSVHTINERLRHARRKLDVTSSREAARLLLETEAGTCENLGYKPMGAAAARASGHPAFIDKPGRHLVPIFGGTVIMSLFALTLALALEAPQQSGPTAEAPIPDRASASATNADQARESAARDWLALVDASDWEASFAAAGLGLRELNTVAMWREASLVARVPLGSVLSRETIASDFVAAPPMGYVVIEFRTDFANRTGVTEKVTLEREASGWKVVGYTID